MTVAREMTTDAPSGQEMDVRLSTLRTSLGTIERSIMRYEDLIENCQLQEEARQVETSHEQPEEETSDTEMVDDKGCGGPEPSGPRKEQTWRTSLLPSRTRAPLLRHPMEMPSLPRKTPSSCSQHHNWKVQPLDLIAPGARLVRSWEKWLG